MKLLKKYPLPISGTALGITSLGNLLRTYSEDLRTVLGIIAFILIFFLIVKFILFTKPCLEAMENPVVGGTMATFPMTIMVLSTYIAQFKPIGMIVWYIGLILQIIHIIWFSLKFIKNFTMKKVFPTWFIAFVGIAVAPLTAGPHGTVSISMYFFWFAFAAYFILVCVVGYRVFVLKDIPDPAKPTLAIFAAPGSLLLAAYISAAPQKISTIIYILLFISLLFYVYALFMVLGQITKKFTPAFSSFTFPMAISGLAIKLTNGYFVKAGTPIQLLKSIVPVQELIAALVIAYVLIRYIQFMFTDDLQSAK
ncbi:MAG: TDT family transporter [Clostridiaceae bacterium]